MQASRLKQRVELLELTSKDSQTGANSKQNYAPTKTIWASIEPLSVKDVLTAQAVGSQARLRCVIRYRAKVDSTMRVKYDGKVYKIDGNPLPDKDTGKEYLTLILVSV